MYYKSMNIADYFVKSSIKQNIEINNLKLQKLLYYFYAKKLVEGEENPFDEKFEKWQYGPVLPSIYHSYKQFGGFDISEIPAHYFFDVEENEFKSYEFDENSLTSELRSEIDKFIQAFKEYDSFSLVEKTHQHDEWRNAEQLINMGVKNLEYDDKATAEYFKNNPKEQLWSQQVKN
ncbi:Panacea domain-containing protein [Lactococcus garvieae]|uniref:Panacea domain-containing protein n=1 Tax=Lactococcus garvieae TaxID=1363 RepID=UPI0038533114